MATLLRALIVEDSEDDTQVILRELRRGGYEVEYERVEDAPGDGDGAFPAGMGCHPV